MGGDGDAHYHRAIRSTVDSPALLSRPEAHNPRPSVGYSLFDSTWGGSRKGNQSQPMMIGLEICRTLSPANWPSFQLIRTQLPWTVVSQTQVNLQVVYHSIRQVDGYWRWICAVSTSAMWAANCMAFSRLAQAQAQIVRRHP